MLKHYMCLVYIITVFNIHPGKSHLFEWYKIAQRPTPTYDPQVHYLFSLLFSNSI